MFLEWITNLPVVFVLLLTYVGVAAAYVSSPQRIRGCHFYVSTNSRFLLKAIFLFSLGFTVVYWFIVSKLDTGIAMLLSSWLLSGLVITLIGFRSLQAVLFSGVASLFGALLLTLN